MDFRNYSKRSYQKKYIIMQTKDQQNQNQIKLEQQNKQNMLLPQLNFYFKSIEKIKKEKNIQSQKLLSTYKNKGDNIRPNDKVSHKFASRISCDMEQSQLENHFVPKISANSWVVYEMKNHRFIYGKRIYKKREIASLTKIMNLITTLQLIKRYSIDMKLLKLKISKEASSMIGTSAYLQEGMQISIYDLLFGMMLPSGNDAAYAVAQAIGSIVIMQNSSKINSQIIQNVDLFSRYYMNKRNSVSVFINQMNKLAKQIGMYNTFFANPHGLSQTQSYSTAEDLIKLCTYCMQNQTFRKIVNTKTYKYNYQNKKIIKIEKQSEIETQNQSYQFKEETLCLEWENTNKLLWQNWNGIKTGITPNAGPCLAATYTKIISGNQYNFLIILINSYSMEQRWKEAKQILNWVLAQKIY